MKLEQLIEQKLTEKAPPDPEIEKWIKSVKDEFIERYGKEKGLRILYGKAWNLYNKKKEK
jgi:hypothetical protein